MQLLITLTLVFCFVAYFVYDSFKKSPDIEMDESEFDEMSRTYIFKHPCGEIFQENGKYINFNEDQAIHFAKGHKAWYVKSYTEEHWTFAYKYFNLEEPC
jgi:hypothetical protein